MYLCTMLALTSRTFIELNLSNIEVYCKKSALQQDHIFLGKKRRKASYLHAILLLQNVTETLENDSFNTFFKHNSYSELISFT